MSDTIQSAHDLALELLEILDYAESAAARYPERDPEGEWFCTLMMEAREKVSQLGSALVRLNQPFADPGTGTIHAGEHYGASAHNLVCDLIDRLWSDLSFAVADGYNREGGFTTAKPCPPENIFAKTGRAIGSYQRFPRPDSDTINMLRATCHREFIFATRNASEQTTIIKPNDPDNGDWSFPATMGVWAKRFKTTDRTLRKWRTDGTLQMKKVDGQRGMWRVHAKDPLFVQWNSQRKTLNE